MQGDLFGKDLKLGDRRSVSVRERQRYMPLLGWDSEYLFYTDGNAWCDEEGRDKHEPKYIRPPRGFVWIEDVAWGIDVVEGSTDRDGWRYGWNVTEKHWAPSAGLHHVVRFRTWRRECVFDPVAFLAGTEGAAQLDERPRNVFPIHRSLEMWENERWVLFAGFGPNHLLPTDPSRYSNTKEPFGAAEREPQLETGWSWSGLWKIKLGGYPCDDQGWQYSFNFRPPNWSGKCTPGDFVRRRLWGRDVVFHPPTELVAPVEQKSAVSQKNFELITANVLAEIAAEELQIGTGAERTKLIATVNSTLFALNVEENATGEAATSALQFIAATNRAQKGRVLACTEAPQLQQWADGWRARPAVAALEENCTDLEIVKRCKELDYRAASFLQAREQLLPAVEKCLLPGQAQWLPTLQGPTEHEEAEL